MTEPSLRVGLAVAREAADLRLRGPYRLAIDEQVVAELPAGAELRLVAGAEMVAVRPGPKEYRGGRLFFEPLEPRASLVLRDMTVGIDFHWQHDEDLAFSGALEVRARAARGGLTRLDLVNELGLESYLESVISSEMSARCPPALLEAHAVISRSWLLAQLEARSPLRRRQPFPVVRAPDGALELVRWYDREDHDRFDVCADDHCQRYQGVTRASTPEVARAVAATRGLVLTSDGQVCDARFSKCCGGMTELFASAWGDEDKAYLRAFPDRAGEADFALPLTEESHAAAFLAGAPAAFCDEADRALLERLLPELDHETRDFYRWEVRVSAEQVRGWVQAKVGVDLGPVQALVPLVRGPSGRLVRLEIRGREGTLRVGKELEIRRVLSDTHLYSSAFVVAPDGDGFRLRGGGWGHGVGLCQIGAAVMAERGYGYEAILAHYYRGAALERRY